MSRAGADDLIARALAELARYADGVHQLGPPAHAVSADLPGPLRRFYLQADGAELFLGSLVIRPFAELERDDGRVLVGELDGDDLYLELASGAVWRREKDSDELVEESSAFDRFLLGAIDAEAVLYDRSGEFTAGFGDDGELESAAVMARERARLRRDRDAPAPRWRLSRALAQAGKLGPARDELEAVVAARPSFAWAWYDLARLAERLGELEAARDDAMAAAAADPAYPHVGFFWAHAARLSRALGDVAGERTAVERAVAADPGLARGQREAGEAQLEAGELEAAAELAELACVLGPRDVASADLRRRVAAAIAAAARPAGRAPAGEPSGGSAPAKATAPRARSPRGKRR